MDTSSFDYHLLSLIFIILAVICFIIALFLRMFRLRSLSRLFILFASVGLLVYSCLFFISLPGSDLAYADVAQIFIFIFALLLTLYNFIVFIKKR